MMISKGCKLIAFLTIVSSPLLAQYQITGKVIDSVTNEPIEGAEVYSKINHFVATTNETGTFEIPDLPAGEHKLIVFSYQYQALEQMIFLTDNASLLLILNEFEEELSEVVISHRREEIFGIDRLKSVEGTAIYAGKKTEVVLMDQIVGNLAASNARQIYAQVVGLNIYESSDAGLQLSVGGRGLDPNRTTNFNTRQNGYDISADVLGYPESYYTPPAESLSEIQVVRGAASLQYGTQFGGLLSFKMKKPNTSKKLEVISRQSIGSFHLVNSFNSFSGTHGKFSYYTYFNYKRGDGFRPNSEFNSKNIFVNLNYAHRDQTTVSLETTCLDYLVQQGGGLTDPMFRLNPDSSNRTRNWFEVNWKLFSLNLKHRFSSRTNVSVTLFALDAERNAVGFRGDSRRLNANPVMEIDEVDGGGNFFVTRDLIRGNFNNWGAETRLLHRYKIAEKDAVFLLGTKYYDASNKSRQGSGTNSADANFNFADTVFPDYPNQSVFDFPNLNASVFGEHIFFLTDDLSITPGFRFEYIKTESIGTYREVVHDAALNPISNKQFADNRKLERSFILFGVGASYDVSDDLEVYTNISENYRSVTFSDIRITNPTFIIDPSISDEEGYTTDFGIRGKWKKTLSYDVGGFGLLYSQRIGIILDDRANSVRKNIGKAFIYGIEAFADWNIIQSINLQSNQYRLNWFINTALTESRYISSQENNVKGKKVEFIPQINLKSGVRFGYKNLLGSIQFTHLSRQFTDVENSPVPADTDNRNGVIGEIPGYEILDLSLSCTYKKWKVEFGINNVLSNRYFTRRATGYPGPGIIPSEPRSFYMTLQVKL